jgi:hypothetical protein
MRSLSTFFLITLGINPAIAADNLSTSSGVISAQSQPATVLLAEKFSSRRRGECDVSPALWTINVCETTNFCYKNAEDVSIWLPQEYRSGRTTDRLVIKTFQGEIELRWAASQESLPWPLKRMPINSGMPYLIGLKDNSNYSQVMFYQIPAQLSDADEIEWMRQNGCSSQVQMLLKKPNA